MYKWAQIRNNIGFWNMFEIIVQMGPKYEQYWFLENVWNQFTAVETNISMDFSFFRNNFEEIIIFLIIHNIYIKNV